MNKPRIILLAIIVLFGAGLITMLFVRKIKTPYETTLAPAFQILGKTTKTIDRTFSRVIPLDSMDEAEFGKNLAKMYIECIDPNDKDYIYCNEAIKYLSQYKQKPFEYYVFISEYGSPNAFALPGGSIFVTRGLMNILKTEGELVSILAHEMGHIELSHCFDLVKNQMLSEKYAGEEFGVIADIVVNIMLNHTYSKTVENEADEYGFRIIKKSRYEPATFADAFQRLIDYEEDMGYTSDSDDHANVFRDYFMTHPPTPLRVEKFRSQADNWRMIHPKEVRITGETSFRDRTFTVW